MKEQWVKDAHAGGYKRRIKTIEVMLWDIDAWRAVGITRGWSSTSTFGVEYTTWADKMNTFYFRVQNGASIEEALKVIS